MPGVLYPFLSGNRRPYTYFIAETPVYTKRSRASCVLKEREIGGAVASVASVGEISMSG